MSKKRPVLGFIGLGIMGKPMVRNLIEGGHAAHVYSNQRADIEELVRDGAHGQDSPAAVAREAEIIITMVPDTPHVREVVLGDNGVIHSLHEEKVLIDMSTISTIATRELTEAVRASGARMLDAPVSGGEKGAIEGMLSIMVGGDKKVFERCMSVLRLLGQRVTHVGGNSAGQFVKSCNQMLAAATVLAMGKALALGTKAGVNSQKIVEVLPKGAARCWALEVRAPEVLKGNFQPGFKSKLQYKDLDLAMELSHSINAPMPIASVVHEFYKSTLAQGCGEEDHMAVIRIIEQMTRVEIRSE
ncbi:NAD(P)-dependent oxidoreductase [Paraburkholderia sp.]|uniref:NAD(P)-dependent oxidoreductase n=1 Tax=Paraburkholderia sp. TaxID=1926495 RepID=UPI0039E33BB9